ncbi:hypothetical protein, conserved [Eimeria acervulina]|uniref:Uncharacterized protein n=1 Tax=Eimeria acervulina TaxID=5801 RepID=U6GJG5_EIMAC|nr:hypothetical protein, conserved [Eimeria acervulina]CDI78734.1 hypothetical protein, conserved [Eimeria acervulina]
MSTPAPPDSSSGGPPGGPSTFAAELSGFAVVTSATFIDGECKQIVCEGSAEELLREEGEREGGAPIREGEEEKKNNTLSRSLAAAEKTIVPFLAAAAKEAAAAAAATAAGGVKEEEEEDNVANDRLGLDED